MYPDGMEWLSYDHLLSFGAVGEEEDTGFLTWGDEHFIAMKFNGSANRGRSARRLFPCVRA